MQLISLNQKCDRPNRDPIHFEEAFTMKKYNLVYDDMKMADLTASDQDLQLPKGIIKFSMRLQKGFGHIPHGSVTAPTPCLSPP